MRASAPTAWQCCAESDRSWHVDEEPAALADEGGQVGDEVSPLPRTVPSSTPT